MWIGETLDGKYKLVRQLRSGGMGAVYVAERLALGDSVAIKIILPNQNTHISRARFLREAQAAARIRHPNVVQIFDFGQIDENTPYFVMELLHGLSLDEALSEWRRPPLARVVEVFFAICSAVEAGHRRGVMHRDLKPGNVFLARMDDGREIVKVLDFGLARFTHDGETVGLTNPGSLLGTYSYMSPEQVLGETVGPASDVYSLGVILFEMVTGQLPYTAKSSFAMMERVAAGNFTPPRSIVPDLPDNIVQAIEQALSRDPGLRPSSPEALAFLIGPPDVTASFGEMILNVGSRSPGPETDDRVPRDFSQTVHFDRTRTDGMMAPVSDPTITSSDETLAFNAHTTGELQPEFANEWPDLAKFAARDRELETLKTEFKSGAESDGRLLVIVGEPGVGKTVLVKAFGSWAKAQGASVLNGRFYDYEGSQMSLYGAFLTMLASEGDPVDRRVLDLRRADLEARIGDLSKQGGAVGDADKWRVFAAIAAEFRRVAGKRHMVLLFDDLQWAGKLDLELISYLRRALAEDHIVVVGTARDAEAQQSSESELSAWMLAQGRARLCTVLHLEPFGEEEIRTWLKTVFGRLRMRTLDIRRLVQATGGNPYYLYEVIRHLLTTGQIRRSNHAWECVDLARVELPESVNNAVRAVLADLDRDVRSALETAVVIGDQFRFETLQGATDLDEDALDELLERALARQIISDESVTRPNDFRFCHAAVRQVLYEDLPARRRRRLHERVVRALESVYGDRLHRIAATLCYHQHAVGNWEETLRWGLRAGEEALMHYDLDRAEINLFRAHEAAEQLAREGVDVQVEDLLALDLHRGVVLLRLGRVEEARALLKKAIERASAVGNDEFYAEALTECGQCYIATGDLVGGLDLAQQAAAVAEKSGDRAQVLVARALCGHVLRRLGRASDAEALLDELNAEMLPSDSPSLRSMIFQHLSLCRTQRGQFTEGESLARQALALAREANDPLAEQQAVAALAFVKDESGEYERALQLQHESLRFSRTLALRRREAIDLANIGEAAYRLGRKDEALAQFEEALEIFVEIKDRACEGDCTVNVGRALLAVDRVEDAFVKLDRGIEICKATGRKEYQAIGLYYIAEAYLRSGKPDLAERAFKESLALFSEQNWHDTWRVEGGIARAALAQGAVARARDHLNRAIELAEIARSNLPPHADFKRFSTEVQEVFDLKARISMGDA